MNELLFLKPDKDQLLAFSILYERVYVAIYINILDTYRVAVLDLVACLLAQTTQ